MLRLFEYLLLRGLLVLGLPALLALLALGPAKCRAIVGGLWAGLWWRKQEPEEVIEEVLRQYRGMVAALNQSLERAHAADATLERNIRQSEANLEQLELESRTAAHRDGGLEERGVRFKIDLERRALDSFREQRTRHARQIDEIRRNLYAAELQLRQYEVGRELLLSQLAEAKSVEQQYRIASEFDPFSAVANWRKAENMVEEKQMTARVIGRVEADLRRALEGGEDGAVGAPPGAPAPAVEQEQAGSDTRGTKRRVSEDG
jgi:phage shock protein A